MTVVKRSTPSRRRKEGWLGAFAPATISNFGSGFDAFGVAVRPLADLGSENARPGLLGDIVRARRTKSRGVRISGITGDGGRLPRTAFRNCAAVAALAVLKAARARFGLDLVLEKGLPLRTGIGSSAASAAAGAWAARLALEGEPRRLPSKDDPDLLEAALAGEHAGDGAWHGDSVWAALLGGTLVVASTRPAEILVLHAPPRLRLVVVLPEFELDTRRARAVLPKLVPLREAAAQAARFASLSAAWVTGDRIWIGRGLEDRLAEPARARLVPGFREAKQAALMAGAHGMTFSGAGPSVVAVTPEGREESVGRAIQQAFGRAGLVSRCFLCATDPRGAREVG